MLQFIRKAVAAFAARDAVAAGRASALSRRNFLLGVGVAGAAVMLPSLVAGTDEAEAGAPMRVDQPEIDGEAGDGVVKVDHHRRRHRNRRRRRRHHRHHRRARRRVHRAERRCRFDPGFRRRNRRLCANALGWI
jgi:hypothetical protein